jgi:hypothetical protein
MFKTIATTAAVLLATTASRSADAQHFRGGYLPIHQVHNLSAQLDYELRQFAADAHRHLGGSRHFGHLRDDIRDAQRELADLDRAIHEASIRPDRWDRVARRARAVEKDICDLRDELNEVLQDRRFFGPNPGFGHHGIGHVGQPVVRSQSGLSVAFQFGGGRPSVRLIGAPPAIHQGFPGQRHVVGRPVSPIDPCDRLLSQAAVMHNLANQLVALTADCR